MRILVTGAGGQLGAYLQRALTGGAEEAVFWHGTRDVDLTDDGAVKAAVRVARPDVVLHTAAVATVARCHREPAVARAVNVDATARLAELAPRLVFVSTDLVFDGEKGQYTEADAPAPLSVYGRTKAEAERVVLAHGRHAVARVSLLFGPTLVGRPSFFDDQVAALREGRPVTLFADEWRTPLSLPTAARALAALAASEVTGILHLGGPERLSRLDMGRRLATFLGIDTPNIVVSTRAEAPAPEPRPRDTSLDSGRWRGLFPQLPWPMWEEALGEIRSVFERRTS